MKNNYSILRGALVAAVGLLSICARPMLAADSGNITLQGTVDPVNEITVTPVAGYNSLNLASGATDQQVATINEKNNDPDGYTVTLVSANAAAAGSSQARLKGADAQNSQVVNYSIKYGVDGSESSVTLDNTGSAVVTSTSAASPQTGANKSLRITFSGNSWLNADTYSDTLTLTIAAK
jgi:hypothetical protein